MFREMDQSTPSEWLVGYVSGIVLLEDDTLRMSLSHLVLPMLKKSLVNLRHTLTSPEPQKTMVFGSSPCTKIISTSHTLVPIQTAHVDAPGSLIPLVGDIGEDVDFDDEISSLTSMLSTGAGSLDIMLQTAESQYSLQAEKKMEDYIYELKIYR